MQLRARIRGKQENCKLQIWSSPFVTLLAVDCSVFLFRKLVDFCQICSCTYGMVRSDDNVVHVVWYACRVSSWSSSSWIIWSRVIFCFLFYFFVFFRFLVLFSEILLLLVFFWFFFFFFWKIFLLPVFMLNCQIIADKDADSTRKYLDQVI